MSESLAQTDGICGDLLRWLRAAGARLGPVEIRQHRAHQRSLHTTRPMAPGQIVLEVPLACIITTEMVWATELGRRIKAACLDLEDDGTCLAAFLLQERADPGSFWQPYLATLPAHYPYMPLVYTEAELDLLQGTGVVDEIRGRRQRLDAEYESLCRHVEGFAGFFRDEFLWAKLGVTSRTFLLDFAGEKCRVMVPLADMLDHKLPAETDFAYHAERQSFVLTAQRAFAAEDGICTSYGTRCNSRLLLSYGFCLAQNPENTAYVAVPDVPPGHPLASRAWMLGFPGIDGRRRFQVWSEFLGMRQLLAFLRLTVAQGPDVMALARIASEEFAPVSAANEQAALEALREVCRAAQDDFLTTQQEDQALLAAPELPFNTRHCILLRHGQKQVLQKLMAIATNALELLLGKPAVPSPGFEEYFAQVRAVGPRRNRDAAPS